MKVMCINDINDNEIIIMCNNNENINENINIIINDNNNDNVMCINVIIMKIIMK